MVRQKARALGKRARAACSTKRSITIADHKTSVSLENEFWDSLREIAVERGMSLGALVAAIDAFPPRERARRRRRPDGRNSMHRHSGSNRCTGTATDGYRTEGT